MKQHVFNESNMVGINHVEELIIAHPGSSEPDHMTYRANCVFVFNNGLFLYAAVPLS